jgi:CRISPR-associated protein Csm2
MGRLFNQKGESVMTMDELNIIRNELNRLDAEIEKETDERKKSDIKRELKNKTAEYLNKFKKESISTWIANQLDEEAITYTDIFGRYAVYEGLTTSQIRNIYGEVKTLQMKYQNDVNPLPLRMLQPKLAYAARRADKTGTYELQDILTIAIRTVLEKESNKLEFERRFENFANFFEAILAYHRAYGGK